MEETEIRKRKVLTGTKSKGIKIESTFLYSHRKKVYNLA